MGYPFPWAVHRWLPGQGASSTTIDDPVVFAVDLAEAVAQLQRIPATGATRARN